MGRKKKPVKHPPVLDRFNTKKVKKDISQEPEMIRLKEIFEGMSVDEKDRTLEYMKEEI